MLSKITCARIDEALKKHPPDKKRSAVLPALHAAQEQNGGWLSRELIEAVADYLKLPSIEIYEVATFYDMFELKPCGKYKIRVCTNISCMLRGSEGILEHLKKRLGIEINGSTPDKKFMLKEAECLAACVGAPAMQIDNHYYENLTPEKVEAILTAWNKNIDG